MLRRPTTYYLFVLLVGRDGSWINAAAGAASIVDLGTILRPVPLGRRGVYVFRIVFSLLQRGQQCEQISLLFGSWRCGLARTLDTRGCSCLSSPLTTLVLFVGLLLCLSFFFLVLSICRVLTFIYAGDPFLFFSFCYRFPCV